MTLITDDMKTDWYPAYTPPVRPGVYEVRFHLGAPIGLRVWDGLCWRFLQSQDESNFGTEPCGYYENWRGLTDEGRSYASAMGLYGDGETS